MPAYYKISACMSMLELYPNQRIYAFTTVYQLEPPLNDIEIWSLTILPFNLS